MVSNTIRKFQVYYISLKGLFFKKYSRFDPRDVEEMLNDAFLKTCEKFDRNYNPAKCEEKPFFSRLLKNAFIDLLRVLRTPRTTPLMEDIQDLFELAEKEDHLSTYFDEIAGNIVNTGPAPFLTSDSLLNKNVQFSKLLLKRYAWSDNKPITPKTLFGLLHKKIGGFELSGFLSSDTPFSVTRIRAWLACSPLLDEGINKNSGSLPVPVKKGRLYCLRRLKHRTPVIPDHTVSQMAHPGSLIVSFCYGSYSLFRCPFILP